MSSRNARTDRWMRVMNRLHRAVLSLSRGRIGWKMGRVQAVELHTIGRSTGQRRSTMLTAPIVEDDRIVVIASKGGDDRNPFWYNNLLAHPDAELTINGRTVPVTARTANAEERTELWPRAVAAYSGYASYQKKTSREIPVVICEIRPGQTG
jgi:deazaflavin-dependent oxidoreductase (nitroreductase family)